MFRLPRKARAIRRLLVLGLLLTSCQTVTIRPNSGEKSEREPDFESRQNFFLWGLVPGETYVNVNQACDGEQVSQMQAQNTFLDSFFGLITLGIYAPRTAKVWCNS